MELWTTIDTWIVVCGALSACACALLGNFLILRKMSMMGDAISHAVLPGLAVAFLISGSRGSWVMFLGAIIVGILTAVFTQWISKFGQVEESAAMGVVFTGLFAIGLIILVRGANAVDLDPGCVLYGAIEMVPLETWDIGPASIPRAVVTIGVVLIINLFMTLLFFKELKLSSFDPALSTSLGYPAPLLHYGLMTLVAITTVACFESVGSILVIAMLIVPGATAYLLTNRLGPMLAISLIVAIICALLGHISAFVIPSMLGFHDTSTAGMMAVVAGIIFLFALFFSPKQGVVTKYFYRLALSQRILQEDVLGVLFRNEEVSGDHDDQMLRQKLKAEIFSVQNGFQKALRKLEKQNLVSCSGDDVSLTESGRGRAQELIRSHRLWETYLHDNIELPLDHLHRPAEELEHITNPAMQERLAEQLGDSDLDPQGKRIPDKQNGS